MHGILWKWTNYYSGWQPRWFILQDGVLSYYRSEEEVNSGSKGSINLAVCEVNVCSFDPTRFEIFVSGEQKYFLKASNKQERQKWIVALGSCKASCTYIHMADEHSDGNHQKKLKHETTDFHVSLKQINLKESEMRIYFDLINQQVSNMKSQLSENQQLPDMNLVNETTSTMNAACDTFLMALKELMFLTSVTSESPNNAAVDWRQLKKSESMSPDLRSSNCNSLSVDDISEIKASQNCHLIDGRMKISRRELNFFVTMRVSFVDWSESVDSMNLVDTRQYIDSYISLLSFLDYFDVLPITSLKSDITIYLERLDLKLKTDSVKFSSLDKLLKFEKPESDVNVESVTFIILLLNRGLMFTECFIRLLHDCLKSNNNNWPDPDDFISATNDDVLKQLVTNAYNSTIREKLSWINRGVFNVILKSLPKFSDFLSCLISGRSITDRPEFVSGDSQSRFDQLIIDLRTYMCSLVIINKSVSQLLLDLGVEL